LAMRGSVANDRIILESVIFLSLRPFGIKVGWGRSQSTSAANAARCRWLQAGFF
jgi:hypothetical protein